MKKSSLDNQKLTDIYQNMFKFFGPRDWWPGETKFEICVGAILTQSVSWKNVAKAIGNLKNAGLLDIYAMYEAPSEEIEQCIVPTLYFRMKARKLKAFVIHVVENYNGNLQLLFEKPLAELRPELLGIYGIGQETADSIILYAAEKPIFVVDAYTKRIFSRIGLFPENITYQQMQKYFMDRLEPDVPFYNEYHALIVGVGNSFCGNKKPKCGQCPLIIFCKHTAKK